MSKFLISKAANKKGSYERVTTPICIVELGNLIVNNVYALQESLQTLLPEDKHWRDRYLMNHVSDTNIEPDLEPGDKYPITYRLSKSWNKNVLQVKVHELYPAKVSKSNSCSVVAYGSYNDSIELLKFVKEQVDEKALELQVAIN